jgi:anhydro-N-acetylmuramic acid kinase
VSVYVGVMSGTSLDGLDVAVVDFAGVEERPEKTDVLGFFSRSYTPARRERIRSLVDEGDTAGVCEFDFDLGRLIGEAVEEGLAATGLTSADIEAIGSHGQTIWHVPPAPGVAGSTLQVGNPAVIAEVAGVDVVSDFRSRDMAAGGHGAPLTAYTDHLLFSGTDTRLIQNIGGMANVTLLPALGSPEEPLAFDTGPGMALIDGAVRALTDLPYDVDGRLAAAGEVAPDALGEWLADPYFSQRPPKSTGREHFSTVRLHGWLAKHRARSPQDLVATLTELTARTIAAAYDMGASETAPTYLCGGGARNPTLVARIRAHADPRSVRNLSELGVDPDAREAIAFALLARQHVMGFPANAPWATGASGRRLLGTRTRA